MDYAEKMRKCHEYAEALEKEKRKIQVFQRELPLCLELVTQAIEACKRELLGTTMEYIHGQSECSEQTSSDGPVLEEFIPVKRPNSSYSDEDDSHDLQSHKRNKSSSKNDNDHKKKSEWLRSVQLWNQSADPPSKELDVPRKAVVTEVKRNGGAFQPFHREKDVGKSDQTIVKTPSTVPASATSSSADTATGGTSSGGSSRKEEKDGLAQRKQRRCWSADLHKRFLHALQQLGGSHVATPKQIREIMKVDGLTNDEVKSHLQKYRLHTRRPSHNSSNPQAPQFVVVGGIWVPPPEYAAMAATTTSGGTTTVTTANGIYAPVAAPPSTDPQVSASLEQKPKGAQSEPLKSEERGSHSEGDVHSNSPATSSSTPATTNSPAFG